MTECHVQLTCLSSLNVNRCSISVEFPLNYLGCITQNLMLIDDVCVDSHSDFIPSGKKRVHIFIRLTLPAC